MKRRLLGLLGGLGLLAAVAGGVWAQQGATVNPVPGSVWTYLGPTFGASWVLPSLSPFTNIPINPLGPPFNCVGDGVVDDRACMQAAMDAAQGNILYLGNRVYAIGSPGLVCNKTLRLMGGQANQANNYGTVSGFKPLAVNMTMFRFATGKVCDGSHFEHFSIEMGAAGMNTSGAAIDMQNPPNNFAVSDVAINRPCIGIDLNGNTITLDRVQITQVSGAGCGGVRVGHYTTGAATADARILSTTVQGCGPTWNPCLVGGVTTPADYGIRIEDSGGLQLKNIDILFTLDGTVVNPSGAKQVAWTFCTDTVFGDTVVNTPLVIESGTNTSATDYLGGSVRAFFAQDCWGAAYTSTSGKPGIYISNTGNAAGFSGFKFSGQRIFSVSGEGIYVKGSTSYATVTASIVANQLFVTATSAPIVIGSLVTEAGVPYPAVISGQSAGAVGGAGTYSLITTASTNVSSRTMTLTGPQPTEFTLDGGSALCGIGYNYDTAGGANAGVHIGSGVYNVAIRNSTVKSNCQGVLGGRMLNSIVLDGNNFGLIITGNDLEGFYTGQAIQGEPFQPDGGVSPFGSGTVISGNKGVDDIERALSAANQVDFGVYSQMTIGGATTVRQLLGCWAGHKIAIRPTGGLNFADGGTLLGGITGGNLPLTPATNVIIQGTAVLQPAGAYPACKWYLR